MRASSPTQRLLPALLLPNLPRMVWWDRVWPAQIVQASDTVFKCSWWLGCSVVPMISLASTFKGTELREWPRKSVFTYLTFCWKLIDSSLFGFSNRNKILPTCIFLICHCPWMSKNLKICWNHLDKLFLQGYYAIPVGQVVVLALLGKHTACLLSTTVALLYLLENKNWARRENLSQGSRSQLYHELKLCIKNRLRFSKSFGSSLGFLNLKTLNIWWPRGRKYHMNSSSASMFP